MLCLRGSDVSKLILHSPMLLFAVVYGIAVYALWIGIDFGTYWDDSLQYDVVINSYQNVLLLPRVYNYPSMIYWIDLISVADKLVATFGSIDHDYFTRGIRGWFLKPPLHDRIYSVRHVIPFDFRFSLFVLERSRC
jgi:hypothetical protein